MPRAPLDDVVAATERLRLRRFRPEEDAPFVLRLANEPAFLRFIGDRGVRSLEDARRYIEQGPIDSYRGHGFGLYLVARNTDAAPIGVCGLMRKPWLDAPDLAYALAADFGEQGYGTEAARAVLEHARSTPELGRVVAVVMAENGASIRVLEKLGFEPEGTVADPADNATLQLYARRLDVPKGDHALRKGG